MEYASLLHQLDSIKLSHQYQHFNKWPIEGVSMQTGKTGVCKPGYRGN
jgi:hypothetical protein